MEYNPFKLYLARIKHGLGCRVTLGSLMFLLGFSRELIISQNGEIIFQSHLFGGGLYVDLYYVYLCSFKNCLSCNHCWGLLLWSRRDAVTL